LSITVLDPEMLWRAALIVLAAAASAPATAGVTYSYRDVPSSAGHSVAIGLVAPANREDWVYLVTADKVYAIPHEPTPILPPMFPLIDATGFVAGLNQHSVAASIRDGDKIAYGTRAGFTPVLVTFDLTTTAITRNRMTGLVGTIQGGIAEDEARRVYVVSNPLISGTMQGIMQYQSFADTTLLRIIGGAGPGTLTVPTFALAVGEGSVYALDEPNSRVNRYDTANGDYLGSFSVTGVTGSNAMAFGPSGVIYLTDGQGGAIAYGAATGEVLNTFQPSSINPYDPAGNLNEPTSRDAMVLDAQGRLFVWDQNSGFHAYTTLVPEPGTLGLIAVGGLLLAAWKRRT
jgi:hypothetical protein